MTTHKPGEDTGDFIDDATLRADDAFLDALGRGCDPSAGGDPLAALLLQLHEEVAAPGPQPPRVEDRADLFPPVDTPLSAGGSAHASTETTMMFPAVTTPNRDSAAGDPSSRGSTDGDVSGAALPDKRSVARDADVVDLATARRRRRQPRRGGWLGAGLTGAAAATLIIAGGGALIHSAEPGDALWGLNESFFGNHAAVVKLASTLEEADNRNAKGDVSGALELLEQAKTLAQEMNAKQASKTVVESTTATVTVTSEVTRTEESTVTESPTTTVEPSTITVTQSVTVTPTPKPSAVNLAPGIKPSTVPATLPVVVPTALPSPTQPASQTTSPSTTATPSRSSATRASVIPTTVAVAPAEGNLDSPAPESTN